MLRHLDALRACIEDQRRALDALATNNREQHDAERAKLTQTVDALTAQLKDVERGRGALQSRVAFLEHNAEKTKAERARKQAEFAIDKLVESRKHVYLCNKELQATVGQLKTAQTARETEMAAMEKRLKAMSAERDALSGEMKGNACDEEKARLQHTRICIEKALSAQTREVGAHVKAKSHLISALLLPAINRHREEHRRRPAAQRAVGHRALLLRACWDALEVGRPDDYVRQYAQSDLSVTGEDMTCHEEFPISNKGTGVEYTERRASTTTGTGTSALIPLQPLCVGVVEGGPAPADEEVDDAAHVRQHDAQRQPRQLARHRRQQAPANAQHARRDLERRRVEHPALAQQAADHALQLHLLIASDL